MIKTSKDFVAKWLAGPKTVESLQRLVWFLTGRKNAFKVKGERVLFEGQSPPTLSALQTATLSEIQWVPVEIIRTKWGAAFTPEQHHFVRYYESGFEELKSFFDVHQPSTPEALYFLGERGGETVESRSHEIREIRLWGAGPVSIPSKFVGGNQWMGPCSNEQVRATARRLDSALHSIERYGFIFENQDWPSYRLLINDESGNPEDYRVVVTNANHRIAALVYLGWSQIPMVPSEDLPSHEIRLSGLNRWPGVMDKTFSEEEARAVFFAFFREMRIPLIPDW